ncbi:RNA-guided pseudouridylation complex pseudouridine synthase subunit Cbf5 [Natranaeroarchaeum aerophilus]|uniref:Probable tRNA pseudouridine synthase B n=1 Tax=Natranaeroarchaeum aerophilus TaxID=2917711 RepID=A0AAE3FR58_9EURY|nr:RNA-guided pseudouridylation complex pseudouridine synthase subunit Cbf5 [Natranaeroarchaeum aerophilus]MCL9814132.1 RNA-guided pseudouridylation complex pseudouridine synthase subunit Cbf5 [Natranaeroarchaeum aerophilus]
MRGPPAERSPAELLSFGVINLDKPPGPSAHQVTGDLRDAVGEHVPEDAYAGEWGAAHSGTLDPKVTGCLPVLLGDATRLAQVFLEGSKEYVAVLELHDDPPSDIEAVVSEFEGRLYQKPPKKSAVSRRLRVREIYDLDLLEVRERQALLRIRCESGTYIRKLCHDIGLALGTGGHMGHLRRTATDPFDDTDLHTMHDLVDALAALDEGEQEQLRDVISPAERALTHIPRVTIAHSAAQEVAEGAPVYAPGVIDVDGVDEKTAEPLVACYTPDGAAVCLGHLVGDPDAERGIVVELERVLV